MSHDELERRDVARRGRRVAIISPFSLGYLIDPRLVHADGRHAMKEQIADALAASKYWQPPAPRELFRDFDRQLGRRLRDAAPDWLVSVNDAVVADLLMEHPALASPTASLADVPTDFTLDAVDVGVTEFGFGAVRLEYKVSPAGGTREDASSAPLEVLDHGFGLALVAELATPLAKLLDDLDACLPDELRLAVRDEIEGSYLDSGRTPLWSHNLMGCDDVADRALADIPGVVPVLDPDRRGSAILADGAVLPGLGTTLVLGREAWQRSCGIMTLAQAYYASTASTERVLLRLTARAAARRRNDSTRVRQEEVRSLHRRLEIASLVAQSLGTLDVHLAASTIDETRVWRVLADEWAVGRQLALIDGHLHDLREAGRHLQDELRVRRERLFGEAAFMFAAFAVISTVFDLFDFNQGPRLVLPDSTRITVTALAIGLLLIGLAALVRRRQ